MSRNANLFVFEEDSVLGSEDRIRDLFRSPFGALIAILFGMAFVAPGFLLQAKLSLLAGNYDWWNQYGHSGPYLVRKLTSTTLQWFQYFWFFSALAIVTVAALELRVRKVASRQMLPYRTMVLGAAFAAGLLTLEATLYVNLHFPGMFWW